MGGTARTLTYTYDAGGRRTRIVHPDGTWFGMLMTGRPASAYLGRRRRSTARVHRYTPRACPTGRAAATAASAILLRRHPAAVRRDPYLPRRRRHRRLDAEPQPGRPDRVASTHGNDAYAWTGHYAVNRAYTTNGLNQYTAAGGATFAYDANGNLISDGVDELHL